MASTAWINPTALEPTYTAGYSNPTRVFAFDSSYATATRENDPQNVLLVRWTSSSPVDGTIIGSMSLSTGVSSSTLSAISTGFTVADLKADLLGVIVLNGGSGGSSHRLSVRGFDFSGIADGSVINSVAINVQYSLTTTLVSLDSVRAMVDYTPPGSSAAATSIASSESVPTPAVSGDPVYASAPSIASAESFGPALLTMNASISSGMASSEAFDTATSTLGAPPPPPPTDWEAIGKETTRPTSTRCSIRPAPTSASGTTSPTGLSSPSRSTRLARP